MYSFLYLGEFKMESEQNHVVTRTDRLQPLTQRKHDKLQFEENVLKAIQTPLTGRYIRRLNRELSLCKKPS